MKMLPHSVVWWPNIEDDMQRTVKTCEACQKFLNVRNDIRTVTWPEMVEVLQRICIDFLQHKGSTMLILYDHFSKWIKACIMQKINAVSVTEKLWDCFVTFGIPYTIVVIKIPPYHPKANRLAERVVQSLKQNLNKLRNTPSFLTKQSPADIIFKHKPKTRLSMLKPQQTPLEMTGQRKSNRKLSYKIVSTYKLGEKVLVQSVKSKLRKCFP
ncbi:hypothetical protein PR048_011237, partial [Dryococelus australis]